MIANIPGEQPEVGDNKTTHDNHNLKVVSSVKLSSICFFCFGLKVEKM